MSNKLQVWSPFSDLWNLQDDVNRLFKGFGVGLTKRGDEESQFGVWAPLVDVKEDGEAVTINAELPGMKREDVKLSVNEGVLTIKGERKFEDEKKKGNYHRIERYYGTFSRSFTLPSSVDSGKIRATMKDGLLEVYLPKSETAKPKEITIDVK
jgi:HSP20 family protein